MINFWKENFENRIKLQQYTVRIYQTIRFVIIYLFKQFYKVNIPDVDFLLTIPPAALEHGQTPSDDEESLEKTLESCATGAGVAQ